MHAIFIPYGIKDAVEILLRDMQSQKFQLKVTNPEGNETKIIWMQGGLRVLPFGVLEYVFPKESADLVLSTLRFHGDGKGTTTNYVSKPKLWALRKALKAQPIPPFKSDKTLLWMMDNVSIIPIGIREDGEVVEPLGELKGWVHEAI